MFECSDCYKEFTTAGGLHAHCRAKADHAYCEDCERLFVGDFALNQVSGDFGYCQMRFNSHTSSTFGTHQRIATTATTT